MAYPSQLSVPEAIALIEAQAQRLAAERVALGEALGRTLAAQVSSLVAHPSLDNSALDGFACRAEDTVGASRKHPVTLRVIGEAAAGGRFAGSVGSGEALSIYTGAPVPDGANAIIRVEDTETRGESVLLFAPANPDDIRPRGQDFGVGEVLLKKGQYLDAAALGLAAAMGHAELPVVKRPRVGILSTGDEIVEPGNPIEPGQVYDANRYALAALVRSAGGEPVHLPPVADDPALLEAALALSGGLELLLTSGGVSMGRYDFVRDLLFQKGEVYFWKVAMRPAGPVLFGRFGGAPVLGLPGNPVSSIVAFLILARAFLQRALGSSQLLPYHHRLSAVAGTALKGAGFKEAFTRVRLTPREDGRLEATSTGNQSSGVLSSMLLADALAVIPPERHYEPGDRLEVILLEPYLR